MLNGFWTVEIADERGMRARALVLFRDGAVVGDGNSAEIAGSYEEQDNAILASLDVVLRGTDVNNVPVAERVHLHVQGWAIGYTITACGIDVARDGRRVDIRLEYRSPRDTLRVRSPLTARNVLEMDAGFAKSRLPGEIRDPARNTHASTVRTPPPVNSARASDPPLREDASSDAPSDRDRT
jgi:hypothetical protein